MIDIRAAAPSDAGVLSEIAFRSKAHWGYSEAFMAACRQELTVTADLIQSRNLHFFVAESGAVIQGFHALEQRADAPWELEALFVDPAFIGRGVGKHLIHHAISTAQSAAADALVIQGDPNAEGFYLSIGAERVGARESHSIAGRLLPLFRINLKANRYSSRSVSTHTRL